MFDPIASYDPNYKLFASVTEASGRITTYTYNPVVPGANPTSVTITITTSPAAVASTVTEVYTNNRLSSRTDERGLTLSFLYDNLGRVTRTTYPDATTEETEYSTLVNGVTVWFMDPIRIKNRQNKYTSFTYNGYGRSR